MCKENEDGLVKCARCERMELPDDLIKAMNGDKICEPCHEIYPSPTDDECDQCPSPSVTNINGLNLCADCLENYH